MTPCRVLINVAMTLRGRPCWRMARNFLRSGAPGRTRTSTSLRKADFESAAVLDNSPDDDPATGPDGFRPADDPRVERFHDLQAQIVQARPADIEGVAAHLCYHR